MLTLKRYLVGAACLLLFCVPFTHGALSINLIGATLLDSAGGAPLSTGRFALLVADTNGNGFSPAIPGTLTAAVGSGSAWGAPGSGDVVIWTGAVNNLDGPGQLTPPLISNLLLFGDWSSGDPIGLFWFGGVDFVNGGTSITNGDSYGFFTSGGGAWLTQDNATLDLNFLTPPFGLDAATGYATIAPVPEPSTYALLGGVLALGLVAWRRFR